MVDAYRPAHQAVPEIGGFTMGTHWRVRAGGLHDTDPSALKTGIEAIFDRIIVQMSPWQPDSWLSGYNGAVAGSLVAVPVETAGVLAAGIEIARQTGGAFDPAIGALVELWGFGAAERRTTVPEPAEIDAARACSGWQRLRFEPVATGGRLLQPGGLRLDLSGIAKGHAVDQLADHLVALGLKDCLVEIGGEWAARGLRPDGSPWRIGVDGLLPDVNGRVPGVPLRNAAIASSGDVWHGFEHGGRRYGHTIDPRSGWPAGERIESVSVVDRQCLRADALATALLVLGPEEGPAFAEAQGIAALFRLRGNAGSEAGSKTEGDAGGVVRTSTFERWLADEAARNETFTEVAGRCS